MDVATNVELPQILSVFTEEITNRSGEVVDVFVKPSYVQARSVLPRFAAARPGDRLQAGVALRAARGDVRVHPYLFRLVCRNGAILVEAAQSQRLIEIELLEVPEAMAVLRQSIGACCAAEAFTEAMARVRDGAAVRDVHAIQMMPIMAHMARRGSGFDPGEIWRRFLREADPTPYGLANAITSVARDTSDRRLRWDLEELGGAVLTGDLGPQPHLSPQAARATSVDGVLV
ncbi:MAG TPA: hypothetical protein VFY71_18575 [Planctomycetota bacterium]|nr:hypothetical protein [Planctomycetota bacterium]